MGNGFTLPGLPQPGDTNDDFQAVADEFNYRIREHASELLRDMLKNGELPEHSNDAGPTVLAMVAAMFHSAGYLVASFEPHLNGDAIAGLAKAQFNEGRADFRLYNSPAN